MFWLLSFLTDFCHADVLKRRPSFPQIHLFASFPAPPSPPPPLSGCRGPPAGPRTPVCAATLHLLLEAPRCSVLPLSAGRAGHSHQEKEPLGAAPSRGLFLTLLWPGKQRCKPAAPPAPSRRLAWKSFPRKRRRTWARRAGRIREHFYTKSGHMLS